jgi:hypothetical protein
MDPLTLVLLAASFLFVVVVGAWLGAGFSDSYEGVYGMKVGTERPLGVQEDDLPPFRFKPA